MSLSSQLVVSAHACLRPAGVLGVVGHDEVAGVLEPHGDAVVNERGHPTSRFKSRVIDEGARGFRYGNSALVLGQIRNLPDPARVVTVQMGRPPPGVGVGMNQVLLSPN